jgi:NIMA (never in mitosis gene a)-related kinase
VRRQEDGEIYALKKVRLLNLSDREKENALNEVRILASLNHPNVIAYKEAFIDEPSSSLWYCQELYFLKQISFVNV